MLGCRRNGGRISTWTWNRVCLVYVLSTLFTTAPPQRFIYLCFHLFIYAHSLALARRCACWAIKHLSINFYSCLLREQTRFAVGGGGATQGMGCKCVSLVYNLCAYQMKHLRHAAPQCHAPICLKTVGCICAKPTPRPASPKKSQKEKKNNL